VELGDIGPDDDTAQVTRKVADANLQAIKDTAKIVDSGELERAAQAILNASRISIHAVGPAYTVAWEAFSKFHRAGLPVTVYSDLHTQMTLAGQLQKGDVAFGISSGGHSIATIEPLKAAREQGATTICLTRFSKSPLTETSDIRLFTAAYDSVASGRGRGSRTAMLFVVETLFALVTHDIESTSSGSLERSRRAIRRLRKVAIKKD
jgi:DNA-binding MurR/RpiR family transcriptional regulator